MPSRARLVCLFTPLRPVGRPYFRAAEWAVIPICYLEPTPELCPVHSPGPHPAAAPDHADAPGDSTSLPCPISPPPVTSAAPEISVDSASFWKNCNEAGCTKAIFSGFIQEMNAIAGRVESGQASQEGATLSRRLHLDCDKVSIPKDASCSPQIMTLLYWWWRLLGSWGILWPSRMKVVFVLNLWPPQRRNIVIHDDMG